MTFPKASSVLGCTLLGTEGSSDVCLFEEMMFRARMHL